MKEMKTTKIYLDFEGKACSWKDDYAEIIEKVMPASFYPNGQTLAEIEQISDKEIAKRKKANENRKAKDDAMRSIGMVKVKGNLGGTYWE